MNDSHGEPRSARERLDIVAGRIEFGVAMRTVGEHSLTRGMNDADVGEQKLPLEVGEHAALGHEPPENRGRTRRRYVPDFLVLLASVGAVETGEHPGPTAPALPRRPHPGALRRSRDDLANRDDTSFAVSDEARSVITRSLLHYVAEPLDRD